MPLIPGQPNSFFVQPDKQVPPKQPPQPSSAALQEFNLLLPTPVAQADHTRVEPSGKALGQHAFLDLAPDGRIVKATSPEEQKRSEQQAAIEKLKTMKPAELHKLGRKDPTAFFKTLLPAALESERKYGSPAVMTLVQAAVESDFARSPIGGYNLFGIKGEGPAGTVNARTREVIKGKNHHLRQPFAKYHNFYEAASAHGQLFTNGYYDKAMEQYAKDKNVMAFIDNISKTYATDPHYARTLKAKIAEYGILDIVARNR